MGLVMHKSLTCSLLFISLACSNNAFGALAQRKVNRKAHFDQEISNVRLTIKVLSMNPAVLLCAVTNNSSDALLFDRRGITLPLLTQQEAYDALKKRHMTLKGACVGLGISATPMIALFTAAGCCLAAAASLRNSTEDADAAAAGAFLLGVAGLTIGGTIMSITALPFTAGGAIVGYVHGEHANQQIDRETRSASTGITIEAGCKQSFILPARALLPAFTMAFKRTDDASVVFNVVLA